MPEIKLRSDMDCKTSVVAAVSAAIYGREGESTLPAQLAQSLLAVVSGGRRLLAREDFRSSEFSRDPKGPQRDPMDHNGPRKCSQSDLIAFRHCRDFISAGAQA